jgi:hypothetical protein
MENRKEMKFNDLLKSVILENSRYDILKKTLTEPKKKDDKVIPPKMSVEEFNKIVLADPTTRKAGDEIKKAGTYVNWLIKQYLSLVPEDETEGTPRYKEALKQKKNLFFEDLFKTTQDLQKFDKFKHKLPQDIRDINKLSLDSLYDAVKEFDLTMATTTKSERKSMPSHPGGDLVFDGDRWRVVKITDKGSLGKEAACFYGGNGEETRWCTSAPGLNYFNGYISRGPLYVIMDKNDTKLGPQTGLPMHRYQWHFQDQQFMDINDRQMDWIGFLNGDGSELKDFFKPEIMKNLSGPTGNSVVVEYPRDATSKYIALYGFDEFFDELPKTLQRFDFTSSSGRGYSGEKGGEINLELPEKIGDYKNLEVLHLDGVISKLPNSIGNLKKLQFLSLPNNKNLKALPESIADLPQLMVLNLKNSNPNIEIPQRLKEKIESGDIHIVK